ncbi:hypothetical protein EGM85_12390, partial [Macrococcus caseolyticus]
MTDAVILYDYEWQTLRALANTAFPPLHADGLLHQRACERVISMLYTGQKRALRLMLHALSFRGSAVGFTRSYKLVTEMTEEEVQQVFLGFVHSRIGSLRMFATGITSLALLVAYRVSPELRKTLGDADTHPHLLSIKAKINTKEVIWHLPKFAIPPHLSPNQLVGITTDVVIVVSVCLIML